MGKYRAGLLDKRTGNSEICIKLVQCTFVHRTKLADLRLLAMLIVAFILGVVILPSLATPPLDKLCPEGCNCTNYVATCDRLAFPTFKQDFLELRLIRVKELIIIDAEFFERQELSSLTTLYIESSTIFSIDPLAFQHATKLSSIHFVNCTLPELAPDTFVYATSLRLLNIDQCNLEKIEALKSESLQQLKISFCRIKEITKAMFKTLDEITDINLQGNKIEKIEPGSFNNLVFLVDLNLSYNNISQLPPNIFDENDELMSVDMRGNPLEKIDTSIFSNLEQLILSNCQLREFDGSELEQVVNLDLSNNLLTELPSGVFRNMINLEYLNLSRNRLTSLPSDIFANNSRLSRIVLDRNDFHRLPKFKNSENLQTQSFSCNECGLESIEANVFEDMPALVSLHLTANRIKKLDSDVFNTLRSLRVLDISYNSIQDIDMDIFQYNTGLKKLNLAGNNIPYINPEIFANNHVFENLDISNNGIQQIWKSNTKNITIQPLSVLNLADNKLIKISVSDLEVVPNLKVLNLNNNNLECTEELKASVKWLNMRTVIHSSLGMNADLTMDQMMTYTDTYWNDLYNSICTNLPDPIEEYDGDDEIEEDEYDKVVYDDIDMLKFMNNRKMIPESDEPNEYFEQDVVVNHKYSHHRYSFFWPALVFFVTALFVLFIVTNMILCVLRKRGQLPRNINLTWKNGAHSGFVYKPLTEDISRPRSIIITQGDKPQAPNL
ncbi:hypothetical protein Trydic_g11950 [Trypoxylus dichotomus]